MLRFLPEALRQKDLDIVRQFEERFEPVGLAALGGQIVTGLWLPWLYLPDWSVMMVCQGVTQISSWGLEIRD